MDIKPGTHISLTVNIDHLRETVDVKNSVVHDVEGARIVIAQTDPPVPPSQLDRVMYVTYLEKEKGKIVRYGFPARITEFIKNYKLSSDEHTQAIVLIQEADAEPYNLRMFFRLEPPSDSGLDIFVNDRKVNIIDISIGGASFSHDMIGRLPVNSTITIVLNMDGIDEKIEAQVLRVWEPGNERLRKSLEMVSVQFLGTSGNIKNALSRKIRDIERKTLLGGGFRKS